MITAFTRTDTSVVGRWWWTIDRWLLVVISCFFLIGMVLILAAGPPAADRIGAGTYYFVKKQSIFIPLAIAVMLAISIVPPNLIKRLAIVGLVLSLAAMLLTLIFGTEVNGAKRWLRIASISIQPSEFVKPFFVVATAWMFNAQRANYGFPGNAIALGFLIIISSLLLSQPDVGMTLVVVCVWCAQLFIAGLSIFWVFAITTIGLVALLSAYFLFPHVASRVNRFLDPTSGDTYQVDQSILAFKNGGFFGRGPGEGRIKEMLPDAHTDFIFAVAGEEFGCVLCLLIITLFVVLVIRSIVKVHSQNNMFVMLSVGGLCIQISLQAIINMASSLNMMPTKGMTLPFISYGGSSSLALAIGAGMILSLTRRNHDIESLEK